MEFTNAEMASSSSSMDTEFESDCPICCEQFQSPVLQCNNGHLICHSCEPKCRKCPECRQPMPKKKIRNIIFEKMLIKLGSVEVPCPFMDSGCFLMIKKADLENHKLNCAFAPKKTEQEAQSQASITKVPSDRMLLANSETDFTEDQGHSSSDDSVVSDGDQDDFDDFDINIEDYLDEDYEDVNSSSEDDDEVDAVNEDSSACETEEEEEEDEDEESSSSMDEDEESMEEDEEDEDESTASSNNEDEDDDDDDFEVDSDSDMSDETSESDDSDA